MISLRSLLSWLCLISLCMSVSGCYNFKSYNKIYRYKPPQGYTEVPAYIRGAYLQNVSGLGGQGSGVNERMGYALPVAIDGLTVPRGDTPSVFEQYAYSAGGYALGQGIQFHTYPISPGSHTLTIDITMLGKTKSRQVQMYAQPGFTYQIKGQGGGLSASAWIEDQNGNLAAVITRGEPDAALELYR